MTKHSLRDTIASVVGDQYVSVMTSADVPSFAGSFYQVAPRTPAEVAEVIGICAAFKAPMHPVGSGRRPSALSRDRDRIFVSTRRLDQVVQLDETSLLIHAQAGVTGTQLQKILAPRDLSLGDYPPAVLTSSLGGIISVRTPGKSSARHGFFEDAVVGVSAVLANGKTVHTRIAPRRATGPDLLRAFCGSEGTIGFITSAVMKIHRTPQARFLTAYTAPSVESAIAAVHLALREEAAPAGIRIYDNAEIHAHFKLTASEIAAGPATALVVVGTAGPTDLAACDRDLVASAIHAEGGAPADNRLAETWWRRLHQGESTPAAPPTLQAMATPRKLHATYQAVCNAVAAVGGSARAHISRFDADGALVLFSLIRDGVVIEADTADSHQRALLDIARRAIADAGGWVAGSLHDGPHSPAFAGSLHDGPHSPAFAGSLQFGAEKLAPYLATLRHELDPLGIMNPGGLM